MQEEMQTTERSLKTFDQYETRDALTKQLEDS